MEGDGNCQEIGLSESTNGFVGRFDLYLSNMLFSKKTKKIVERKGFTKI